MSDCISARRQLPARGILRVGASGRPRPADFVIAPLENLGERETSDGPKPVARLGDKRADDARETVSRNLGGETVSICESIKLALSTPP
jgi:hypothetical protein